MGLPWCPAVRGSQPLVVAALILGGVFLMVPVLAAILVPNFMRAKTQGQLTACKSNLRNVGTALEMYSTDNCGRFPTSLGAVTPNYLKRVPTCPSVGVDTYTKGYSQFHQDPPRGVRQQEERGSSVDAYTVLCAGANHSGVNQGVNFPQYTSLQGLIAQ